MLNMQMSETELCSLYLLNTWQELFIKFRLRVRVGLQGVDENTGCYYYWRFVEKCEEHVVYKAVCLICPLIFLVQIN